MIMMTSSEVLRSLFTSRRCRGREGVFTEPRLCTSFLTPSYLPRDRVSTLCQVYCRQLGYAEHILSTACPLANRLIQRVDSAVNIRHIITIPRNYIQKDALLGKKTPSLVSHVAHVKGVALSVNRKCNALQYTGHSRWYCPGAISTERKIFARVNNSDIEDYAECARTGVPRATKEDANETLSFTTTPSARTVCAIPQTARRA